jgi:Na+/H+-dicarboxylate symporter
MLHGLAMFSAVVVGGLFIHMVFVLGTLLWALGRKNPLAYLRSMGTALMTAFATASSAATLPLTMSGAEDAGVSEKATRFVLPLGATINMDGSALYEAVAALFIAQAWGIDIGIGGQILVVITAVLSSVGAAGIPEAGLVTMVVVLQAVGLPLEGLGLLLAIDWLLDRFRTAVNVWGDSVGAAVIERLIPADWMPDTAAASDAEDSDMSAEPAQ